MVCGGGVEKDEEEWVVVVEEGSNVDGSGCV